MTRDPHSSRRRLPRLMGRVAAAVGLLSWICLVPADDGADGPFGTRLTVGIAEAPADLHPGQVVRLSVHLRLPETALVVAPHPTVASETAWVRWGDRQRDAAGMTWAAELVPIASGSLQAELELSVLIPDIPADQQTLAGAPFHPAFLISLFAPVRAVSLSCGASVPALTVLPWPDLPAGSPPFTGLCGRWQSELAVSRDVACLRQPLRITLGLRGDAPPLLFRPPVLVSRDLAVGEPNVALDVPGNAVQVVWDVVPHQLPLVPPVVALSTFDGTAYQVHRHALPVRFLAASVPRVPAALLPEVMTFRPLDQAALRSPYRRMHLALVLVALLAAGLHLAASLHARRSALRRGPDSPRLTAHRRLLQALQREPAAAAVDGVVADLRILLGLPPATSATEMARHLRDSHPDVADALERLENSRFGAGSPAPQTWRALRTFARRWQLAVLLAFCGYLQLGSAAGGDQRLAAAAEAAFRDGDYAAALQSLSGLRREHPDSAPLLINLGNASWLSGRPAHALACYERASRLAPRHPLIPDAIHGVSAALSAGAFLDDPPARLPWRDWLRPDEWCLAAGILACLAAACRFGWGRGETVWRGCRHGLAAAALVCVALAATQTLGPHRRGSLNRVASDLELRTAPADTAPTVGPLLPAGSRIVPAGSHDGWTLIRARGLEGWVPSDQVLRAW